MAGFTHPVNQEQSLGTSLEQTFSVTKRGQVETTRRILTELDPLPPSRRLVVVLPDAATDIFALSKKLWNLAAPDRRQVLLLVKPNSAGDETQSRINLATLASLIRDSHVAVQTQWVEGMSLNRAVRQAVKPDDILVCFEEHNVSSLLKKNKLADLLARQTQIPVYTLKGAVPETTHPLFTHLTSLASLAFCMGVLIAFFALEAWIDQSTAGTLQTVFELLAAFSEVWIIVVFLNRSSRI
jgi:hypothetical protein